jgi:hypothetical protein
MTFKFVKSVHEARTSIAPITAKKWYSIGTVFHEIS